MSTWQPPWRVRPSPARNEEKRSSPALDGPPVNPHGFAALWRESRRLIIGVTIACLLLGGVAVALFDYANQRMAESLWLDLVEHQALYDRERILAPLQIDLTLARQMADSPLLLRWAADENNPALKREALAELNSDRHHFHDGSYFFIPSASGNLYYSDGSRQRPESGIVHVVHRGEADHAWYTAALESSRRVQVRVDADPTLGDAAIRLSVQMRHGNEVVALIGSAIGLDDLAQMAPVSTAQGIYSVLVSADGTILAHPDRRLVNSGASRHTLFDLLAADDERQQLRDSFDRLKRNASAVEELTLTIDGRPQLAAMTYLSEVGWINLVLADTSQLAGHHEFSLSRALLGGIILLTILTALTLLARMVLRRQA
ncbi:MAG: cache domain-containing protein [Azonexus sp.]|jgi:hypothetical protein|nr:cache domain-containing protein [Azonexus sp.]